MSKNEKLDAASHRVDEALRKLRDVRNDSIDEALDLARCARESRTSLRAVNGAPRGDLTGKFAALK